jgi:hypothetical protein
MTALQQWNSFQAILGNASIIDTGYVTAVYGTARQAERLVHRFIVLEHDLFEITVDLATGYTLNAALNHNPPFTVSTIAFFCERQPLIHSVHSLSPSASV